MKLFLAGVGMPRWLLKVMGYGRWEEKGLAGLRVVLC